MEDSKQVSAYKAFLYLVGEETVNISEKIEQSSTKADWKSGIEEYKRIYSLMQHTPSPSIVANNHSDLISAYNDMIAANELQFSADEFDSPEYLGGNGKYKLAVERTAAAISEISRKLG
jgi:hypothetical protein